jgi:hypothetical protein
MALASVTLSPVQSYGQELTGDVVTLAFTLVKILVLSDPQAYPIDPIVSTHNEMNTISLCNKLFKKVIFFRFNFKNSV